MALWAWAALIIVGAIAGFVGRKLYCKNSPFGTIGNIIFGIIGGVVAGSCMAAGVDSSLASLIKTLLSSALGALFLVFILKFITRP